MSLARFSLFKFVDGAAVGAIGATIVNAAAYLIGSKNINVSEIAIIMGVGSLFYGLARGEDTFAKSAEETIKFSLAKDEWEKNKFLYPHSFSTFAAITRVNITGNAISALPGVAGYALFALLNNDNPEFFYGVTTLGLSVLAGSVIETGYQKHISHFKF